MSPVAVTSATPGSNEVRKVVAAASSSPAPSKPVPMLIGGHSKAALRRAARLGDGFIHAGGSAEEFAPLIGEIEEYRKEYGRDHLPFEGSLQ